MSTVFNGFGSKPARGPTTHRSAVPSIAEKLEKIWSKTERSKPPVKVPLNCAPDVTSASDVRNDNDAIAGRERATGFLFPESESGICYNVVTGMRQTGEM